MDALLEEIERLEEETKDKPFIEEEEAEAVETEEEVDEVEEESTDETDVEEEAPAADEEKPAEVEGEESEEDKRVKAQEAYRERQKQKKEDAEKRAAEAKAAQDAEAERQELLKQQAKAGEVSEQDAIKQKLAVVDQIIQKERVNAWINNAEEELTALEDEFKVAFSDYDDLVTTALDITLDRMVSGGMSKKQAQEALRLEKLKIADAAAARGLDPVEAVYNEAKAINTWFETYAEKLGYTKSATSPKGKSMTQKAALREASKPNAVNGGKNASALKLSYDEMDDVSDLTIGQMMSGNY